ncbi:MAG: hypothetical protein ACYC8S_03475 [Minisyncoccota bacterium]
MTIVVREDVASWQLTNTVGHIAAYLGNKMSVPFDTGEHFVSRDGTSFPRNSQFPVVTDRQPEIVEMMVVYTYQIWQSGKHQKSEAR